MDWPTATTELAPGVFAYVQATGAFCVANAGLIAGRDGVTAVDALFTPVMTRALLDEAARVSPRPITRLLNTHHHVDHTLGNAGFPPETQIVAHARAKAEMERVGIGVLDIIKRMAPHFTADLAGAAERLPDVTFDGDTLELRVDERRLQLLHLGTAHTIGDILVYLPDNRILFAGDVAFFYVTPLAFEGHIGSWIGVGQHVLDEIDAETIVPGHGPVGTKDDLRRLLGYLRLVHTGSRAAFDADAPPDDAAAAIDLGEFAEWGESERLIVNVRRCYQEFRGELDALV
jgi:cyclase